MQWMECADAAKQGGDAGEHSEQSPAEAEALRRTVGAQGSVPVLVDLYG